MKKVFDLKPGNRKVLLLRLVHTAFAAYFISCVIYIYYAAITWQFNTLLSIAIVSLVTEGFMVFILNKGHCPLAPLQRKLNDPVPFFNLFLPDYLAKKAIPFFTLMTFVGLLFLALRSWLQGIV